MLERVMGLPAALGQCRRQPGELGNDTLYRFRPSRGRSLRVPFPNHHFNKNIPPFGRIFLLERVMGLEPTISAWKANVLPLHYTRVLSCKWCGRRDLNSYAFRHWNLNPARLPIPPYPHNPGTVYHNFFRRARCFTAAWVFRYPGMETRLLPKSCNVRRFMVYCTPGGLFAAPY